LNFTPAHVTRETRNLNHASNVANQCHSVQCPENEHDVTDGDCTNPIRDWGLNRFLAWRSAMKTFSNVANQCHFVPCPENQHDVIEGDCTNPFRDWGLNRFWARRSAMKTFSNVANQCHFVPCPENQHEANAISMSHGRDLSLQVFVRSLAF
jgi:hypothetical protein